MARIVELRIHGVSGTPPEEMLQTDILAGLSPADVVQVDDDRLTGFYQRIPSKQPYGAEHLLEAYNWSRLTSGGWVKALWLILVPFGLVNAAHFMLPRYRGSALDPDDRSWSFGRICQAAAEAVLRVLGLAQTVVFTLATSEILVDLIAWQWTGAHGSGSVTPRFADPGPWLLGAMAASGLIPLLIFYFGGRRASGAGRPCAPVSPANPLADKTALAAAEFVVGDPDIPSLTRLHLAASGALLGWIGFSATAGSGGSAHTALNRWLEAHGVPTCVVLLAIVTLAILMIGNPHKKARPFRRMSVWVLGWVALLAGAAAWILGAAAMFELSAGRPSPGGTGGRGPLPGIARLTEITMYSGVLLVALLAVACLGMSVAGRGYADRGPFRRYLAGMTSPVLASVGLFLGVGFGAALVVVTKLILNWTNAPGLDEALPDLYPRITSAWALTLLEIVAMVAIGAVLFLFQRGRFRAGVSQAHNQEVGPDAAALSSGAVNTVAFAWWSARVKMHFQWMFCSFGAVGLVLSGFALRASLENGTSGCNASDSAALQAVGSVVDCANGGGSILVFIGTATLAALGAGLIYLGSKSLTSSHWRRTVNVVWDVVAFWPRAAHPLVPPPYTAKALDRLRWRIYYHLGICSDPGAHPGRACDCEKSAEPADRVLLAAHSQGSLLAVAAIAGLRLAGSSEAASDPIEPGQLALLTFGSQLQFAYSRGYPRYVNSDLLQTLVDLFNPDGSDRRGWISLMRETDPVGGQVLSDHRSMSGTPTSKRLGDSGETGREVEDVVLPTGVRLCGNEWRLLDPTPTTTAQAKPIMLRHSGYFLDPAWDVAVGALTPVGQLH